MNFKQRKAQVKAYLGKTVDIKIDRPIGHVHRKDDYSLTYPVNYGYIPDVFGGDGEELDVYLLGVNEPVTEYTCRVIGIAHRENDVEDKLVAAPIGMAFYQNEIAEAIDFQEQYYKTTVESLYQKSCGVVFYLKKDNLIKYLLLFQASSKTWSFPKGHVEKGENEKQTATREVFEETGIKIQNLNSKRFELNYTIGNFIQRTIVLFLSEIDTEADIIKTDEIADFRYVTAEEAKKLLHSQYSSLIAEIENELRLYC